MSAQNSACPVTIETDRGDIEAVYHPVAGAVAAVIWVGGTDGGVMGPAEEIYPTLAADLAMEGVASLRLAFRILGSPGNLPEAVHDVQAGMRFLEGHGLRRVVLVGHSFGAAVVIDAAPRSPEVAAVVTLAAQSPGTERAAQVSPRPLLLVHGMDDQRLPPWCSQDIYRRAREPKKLVLMPGARHSLRQCREELRRLLRSWIADQLTRTPGP